MDKSAYENIESKMNKTISVLKEELSLLRVGRANPAILDKINVSYYGVDTPLGQVASISIPEARVILIQPWDANILKDIEKAIQAADIGINPMNDGKAIRLNFPELTEERRKELVKDVKKYGEDAKVALRSIRRDGIEHFKNMKKNNELTEDDLKDAEKDVQNIIDKFTSEIDALIAKKEKEVIEV